jgi:hypothetical protein
MIVKVPVQLETLSQLGRHSLDSESLRGVVSRVHKIETPLHRIEVGVVRPLTGYEGVDSGIACLPDHVTRTSGDDSDV